MRRPDELLKRAKTMRKDTDMATIRFIHHGQTGLPSWPYYTQRRKAPENS
jgi:hypothetical protein